MTEFTRAESELYKTKEIYDELVDVIGTEEEQNTASVVKFLQIDSMIANLNLLAGKFRRRLFNSRLKDEEDRVFHYGPTMQERVGDFLKKVETLETVWEKRVTPVFQKAIIRYKHNKARQEKELKDKLKQDQIFAVSSQSVLLFNIFNQCFWC